MGIFKKIAEIFRKIVIGYVFYTSVLTLIAFIIIPEPQPGSTDEIMNYVFNVILSSPLYSAALVQIIIWNLTSLILSISMFFFRNTREIVLKKLSGIKERDEREVQIVGKALRASYLGTMTILLFILFMSLIKVEVYIKPINNAEPDKPHHSMTINAGIGNEIINPKAIITKKKGYTSYFLYGDIPFSSSGLILILLIWQIISFRIVSRRASKVPE